MADVNDEKLKRITDSVLEGTPDDIVRRYASLKRTAESHTFGDLDRNIVVVDTEATGLSFAHDELIQIAAARMNDGKIEDWYVTFVDPGKEIPEDIVHLTGITEADVAGAPTPSEALSGLVEFVGDAKIVAHNVEFDRTFTTKHPSGYPLLENVWIDSLDLSRIALPRMRSHRLIDLVHAFDTSVSTHRADADVAATCAIYRILLAGVSKMPRSLVREIASMNDNGTWSTRYVFTQFAASFAKGFAEKLEAEAAELTVDRTSTDDLLSNDDLPAWARIDIPAGPADVHDGKPADGGDDGSGIPSAIGGVSSDADRGAAAGNAPWGGEPSSADESATKSAPSGFEEGPTDDSSEAGSGANSPSRSSKRAKKQFFFSLRSMREARIEKLPQLEPKNNGGESSDDDEPCEVPSADELGKAFSANGLMGAIYPNYEPREEQRAMALAIGRAYESERNLVVEAGTGVGKSMAYLIPSALLAKRNGVTVGVATKTNSLLDQLTFKELPRVAAALQAVDPKTTPLEYAALKGISHYPCLRKVDHLVDRGPVMRDVAGQTKSQAPSLAALLSFIEQSEYDDIDGMKLDFKTLPRYLFTTTSADCLRRKCPYFQKLCFVHGARRRAQAADIVVTNQTFLFCDVAADGGLLPPANYWVIDEAHGAEDEARRAFTREIKADDLLRLAEKVADAGGSRNVFARATKKVSQADVANEALFLGLVSKARTAGNAFAEATDEFATGLKTLLYFDPEKRAKVYERVTIWINEETRKNSVFTDLAAQAEHLKERADKLILCLQNLVAVLEGIDAAAEPQREIASTAVSLRDLIDSVKIIFERPSEAYVYQATLNYKAEKRVDTIEAMPLDVGEQLNKTLYARTRSVVFASATLTVDGSFDSFERALGLNQSEFSEADDLQLDSSFDFDNNMIVYVVKDMPEPNDKSYLSKLEHLLVETHRAQQGSMLTLFTNRREMEKCYDAVKPELSKDDLRLVCQKWGVSVKGLRDDFIKDEHLSLFALKSFWEGFDAPGATLKGVIIPKLPFNRPTDPLSRERALHDRGAWGHYVLPKAVIETKQAAGRLIRSSEDTGILILADKRILSKGYGKKFLNSLQSKTVRVRTIDEIVEEIADGRACARK